tara:strand:- start:225 stop:452 length:228 start_codon:yes stop_codon:yes gene_type:complete
MNNTLVYAFNAVYDGGAVITMAAGSCILNLGVGASFKWLAKNGTPNPLDVLGQNLLAGYGGTAQQNTKIAITVLN